MNLQVLASTDPSCYTSKQTGDKLLRNTTTSIIFAPLPLPLGMSKIDYLAMGLTEGEFQKLNHATIN